MAVRGIKCNLADEANASIGSISSTQTHPTNLSEQRLRSASPLTVGSWSPQSLWSCRPKGGGKGRGEVINWDGPGGAGLGKEAGRGRWQSEDTSERPCRHAGVAHRLHILQSNRGFPLSPV